MIGPRRGLTLELAAMEPGRARSRRWWFLAGILLGIWIAVAAMALPRLAFGKEMLDGPMRVLEVLSVYDGDTFTVRVQIWFGTYKVTRVRIVGIDTPEIRGRCEAERQLAIAAREELARLLGAGEVTLWALTEDKYIGRTDAVVIAAGVNVGERMKELGHARAYDGGKRQGWCG